MFQDAFDPQPTLIGTALTLRPLRADDFEGLFAAAGHPEVWAGHPIKDRHKKEIFEPYFRFLVGTGTTLAIVDQKSGQIIGCSRYYTAPDRPGTISVGFTFLNHAYWGGNTNFELKRLMLGHAFQAYPDVWFHIDPTNIRSQKATAKLGAVHDYDATLDLSGHANALDVLPSDKRRVGTYGEQGERLIQVALDMGWRSSTAPGSFPSPRLRHSDSHISGRS